MKAWHLLLILLGSHLPLQAAELPVYWQSGEQDLWPRFVQYWQQISEQPLIRVEQPSQAQLAIWRHCPAGPDSEASSSGNTAHLYRQCSRYENDAEHPPGTRSARLWHEPAPAQILSVLTTRFPEHQTIGLLIGPGNSTAFRRWQQALPPGAMSLQPLLVRAGERPARVFPLLLPKVSSVVLLQQPLLDDGNATVLLQQALRQGKAVITDNPEWLKLGAAISVSITDEVRLQETARAAQRLVQQRQSFDVDLPVHIEFNYQTLRSLAMVATAQPQEATHGH